MASSTATPDKAKQNRNPLVAWVTSSIGKKWIVAFSGILLVLFVFGHMAGNLTFFAGPDWINAYAKHLEDLGPLLWVIRLALLTIVLVHIGFTMWLWMENQAARPDKYAVKARVKATVFARTMRMTGIILVAFIIFHIAHFTARVIYPEYNSLYTTLPDGHKVRDVYAMMVMGFSHPVVSAFYVLSMGLLAFHLSHGISSLFQTLGLSNRRLQPIYVNAAYVLSWILFLGFSIIPISVAFFGVGRSAISH